MKKIIALLLLICTFALCLVSCASMDKYEDNLGTKYEVEKLKKSEIKELAEDFDLDDDDYDIENALIAEHKNNGYTVCIFECKSSSKAKELEKDLEDVMDDINDYSSTPYYAVRKGKFVFAGNQKAIDNALGK